MELQPGPPFTMICQWRLQAGSHVGTRTPDHNLISRLRICGWEEPEEELPCFVLVVGDWEKTGIALTHVPCDVRERAAIHSES